MSLEQKIKSLPLTSGVYLMKDARGCVIYVGKAIALRKRVQSYFRKNTGIVSKTDLLVADIKDIDILETASEAEALILEASLIKQYKPKYNIDLRDDKSYPLIQVTKDGFPRISVERPRKKSDKCHYYGPYVKPGLIREALSIIRRIFPFRVCDPFPKKECLDYHIGLCDAPCIKKITKKEYGKNIRHVRLILEGKKDTLYRNLKKEMEEYSQALKFEKAAKVRDQLRAIGALYSGTKDINYYKESEQLQRALNLPRAPERVETFDISNIMGQQAVGSMVSFLNGKPDKRNYRRFKIKSVQGIDDFKMMAEVVRRRYRRLKAEGKAFPDLIVIDGGKGQLSAAYAELVKLEVQISIVSLAKREEEIFLPGKRNPVRLSLDSLGLKLLQRTRDEAHRFAITYHRKLRGKGFFEKGSGIKN
ncbi:Excinuclease ABC subunit C [hydrothermal vent metagenome]|uniref:Excinuclease ABC subunit C n=1 Tax=hydrothermal vent metagenome TaxID=652676 RepID=A0A3B1DKL0_9ZZZZ